MCFCDIMIPVVYSGCEWRKWVHMLWVMTEITVIFSVLYLMDENMSQRFMNSITGHCHNAQISCKCFNKALLTGCNCLSLLAIISPLWSSLASTAYTPSQLVLLWFILMFASHSCCEFSLLIIEVIVHNHILKLYSSFHIYLQRSTRSSFILLLSHALQQITHVICNRILHVWMLASLRHFLIVLLHIHHWFKCQY